MLFFEASFVRLLSVLYLLAVSVAEQQTLGYIDVDTPVAGVCECISGIVSNASAVYYPPSKEYTAGIRHWSATNSLNATCVVEPGTALDVVDMLGVLSVFRQPFAVKGGGHSCNPGFSSTAGVQISMTRLNQVTVNKAEGTVDIGAGAIWDDVYEALEPYGVMVAGGRIPGVGVGGFILGGGFSWKSNQYGLAIDTLVAIELVLPQGTVMQVTAADDDLWFGLKGGFNNFGIVTRFTLRSHPQTDVWAGLLLIAAIHLNEFNAAIVKFEANVKDTKASLAPAFVTTPILAAMLFYDGPSQPEGIFDDFLAIPTVNGEVHTQSFKSFMKSLAGLVAAAPGHRIYSAGVPVLGYPSAVIDTIYNETAFWAEHFAALDPTFAVTNALEPFDSGVFSHGSRSAYPPDRARALYPTNLAWAWTNASLDSAVHNALFQSARAIEAAATAEGQNLSNAATYANYALFGLPLEDIYGEHLPRLRGIKKKYDPSGIMDLAGGFKF
ncbi:FAD-binding domain-containing protein [Artomyces pyxidatus]|uniref:FAD-binding domain-containing protein n=1 Tax=Artomyces pyxidatus TaxID=48021 RepID=A0ACB8T4P0_9AGAM|nr:FAD-binding domain-containing protein [Artomyces pyxidatus]